MDKNVIKWIYTKCHTTISKQLLLIFGNGLIAINALFFSVMCKSIIDSATSRNKQLLFQYAFIILLIIAINFILKFFCEQLRENIRATIGVILRKEMVYSLHQKDFKYLNDYHSGELTNRIFSDVDIITEGIIGIIPVAVNLVVRMLGAITILIVLRQAVVVLFIISTLLVIFVAKIVKKRYKYLHKVVQDKQGKMRSFIQEDIENILVVKSFNAEDKNEKKIENYQISYFDAQMKRRTLSNTINAGSGFFLQLSYLMALVWCATGILVDRVGMTYGMITAVLQLVGQVQKPFVSLSGLLPKAFSMIASIERLIELENLPNEVEDRAEVKNIEPSKFVSLQCEQMSFSYSDGLEVLKKVSVTINHGDIVSIQGCSGEGKSTFFLLLMGIYKPQSGKIRIYNRKTSCVVGKETRALFAWVPQSKYIFSGTIRENITFLNDKATEFEIRQAVEVSCASQFINKFPDKMETKVGERGTGLSEGQIQRIAIARAVLSPASILLLDEATSALDAETEKRLLINLRNMKDRTCIIATHRKAALEICNRHFVLEEGELREDE